jgi:hypothetical protein
VRVVGAESTSSVSGMRSWVACRPLNSPADR